MLHSFDSLGAQYCLHDTLPGRAQGAQEWGILDDDSCDDLSRLRDLRVKADYYEVMIEYDEASDAQAMAQRLVAALLGRKAS